MDQCSLFRHVSCVSEILKDGSQAFHSLRYIYGTTKPVAVMDSRGLRPVCSGWRIQMKHLHEQSSRSIAGRSLPLGGSEFVEPVEDHHRNDEAPEDHSRDEEPNSLSPTSGRNLFRRRRGSTDARLWHDFVSHDFARLVAEPTALASSTFRNSGHFRSPGAPGGCICRQGG